MFFTSLSSKPNFPSQSPLFNDPFFAMPDPVFPELRLPPMPLKSNLDVLDIGKSLLVVMPNPHIPSDKIKMSLRKGNILLIEGTNQKKFERKNKHSTENQASHNSIFHQVQLPPEQVDLKKAQFHVDHHSDLLIVTLAKVHPEKHSKNEKK